MLQKTSQFATWLGAKIVLAALVMIFTIPMVQAGQISVFAAASLQEVLGDIAAAFEEDTGHEVVVSFAGSSALARQIEYGAPADVFVSANSAWIAHLSGRGLLADGATKVSYGNALALVVPRDSAAEMSDLSGLDATVLLGEGRIAMALLEAVPAGIYGRQALTALGLWETVASKVAQVDNVRAALALVALGEAQAGVVYVTDAQAEDRVRIVGVFPDGSHDAVAYPAAVVQGNDRPEVRAFMEFWDSDPAKAAFEARGFRVLEDE